MRVGMNTLALGVPSGTTRELSQGLFFHSGPPWRVTVWFWTVDEGEDVPVSLKTREDYGFVVPEAVRILSVMTNRADCNQLVATICECPSHILRSAFSRDRDLVLPCL